jgi:PleD family two-component response regulator
MLMGGEIGVDSNIDEGSLFWFRLPFAVARGSKTDAITVDQSVNANVARSASQRLQILVTDDNRVNQMVVTAMLKIAGHAVDVAASGA